MHKFLLAAALFISGLLFSGIALATPIHVTEHNYGLLGYNPSSVSSCGTVSRDDILIRSSCIGSNDLFSLTTFDVAAIEYLRLTLYFTGTQTCNNLSGNCQSENWQLDLLNTSGSKLGSFDMLHTSTNTPLLQSFIINRSSLAAFNDLFSQGNLWFGFTETSTANHTFRLASSQLAVFALPAQEPTPVPAPATLALLGLGLVGLRLRYKLNR